VYLGIFELLSFHVVSTIAWKDVPK